ncbi:hypothetical protein GCK72_015480 [Caenorhabditis remanei]|uniref:Glycosyltransferase family 92 protein n=1 Tax=Caenorhabditis remanei TaxID=31234 RepID=A0A6A5GU64_CAERE|nr:hypothetical protein GCK72_015480 [Caenorhabditis remanei]KAF1759020.1 hypothetical protein GCK72_015480 [Caenorhabditis remanei]
MNSRNSCLLLSIFIAVNLIIHRKLFLENQQFHLELQKTDDTNFTSSFLHVDSTGNSQNTCVLPEYDIWHADIRKVLTAKFPTNNCDKSFEPWTQLVDSTWRVVNEAAELCLASTNLSPPSLIVIPYQFPMKNDTLCYGNNQSSRELVGHFPSPINTVFVSQDLKMRLGQKVLDHVHMQLDKLNFTSICRRYELKEVPSLIEYDYSTPWNTYEIEVTTKEPSAVHFQTMMTYNQETHTATVAKVVRMDRYGSTAKCTSAYFDTPMCYSPLDTILILRNSTVRSIHLQEDIVHLIEHVHIQIMVTAGEEDGSHVHPSDLASILE